LLLFLMFACALTLLAALWRFLALSHGTLPLLSRLLFSGNRPLLHALCGLLRSQPLCLLGMLVLCLLLLLLLLLRLLLLFLLLLLPHSPQSL
jgi:hypothetical protein